MPPTRGFPDLPPEGTILNCAMKQYLWWKSCLPGMNAQQRFLVPGRSLFIDLTDRAFVPKARSQTTPADLYGQLIQTHSPFGPEFPIHELSWRRPAVVLGLTLRWNSSP